MHEPRDTSDMETGYHNNFDLFLPALTVVLRLPVQTVSISVDPTVVHTGHHDERLVLFDFPDFPVLSFPKMPIDYYALLPTELLAEVILHVRDQCGVHRVMRSSHNHQQEAQQLGRAWLALTQVCRTWRTVGLHCSLLWARIDVDIGEHWVRKLLARSGNQVPLSVRVHFPYTEQIAEKQALLRRVLTFSERVGEVYLSGVERPAVEDALFHLSSFPMSRLRELKAY
jgi:hypothetical protein